jgi:5-methylcytosine-specific restriction endonuclease McrA
VAKNRGAVRRISQVYYEKHREDELARSAQKRVKRNLSRPSSLTAEQEQQIKDFYWLAKDLTAVSGETYHVDHIVPLQGKNVCGLHVPWNLQVLPADINLSKGNRYADDA